jgi:hypothetical protein
MSYHEAIIELIRFILESGEDYVLLIDSGNAYDKTLRNYHQFNYNGEKVYRNLKLMRTHYKFSKNAWKFNTDLSKLYFEHLYPIKLIKEELLQLQKNEKLPILIKNILHKTEIIVITREEAASINKTYKDSMPKNGLNRLEAMEIEIEVQTKNNTLFLN